MPWDDAGNYYDNLLPLFHFDRAALPTPLPQLTPRYRLATDYGAQIRANSFDVAGFTKTGQLSFDQVPLLGQILASTFGAVVGALAAPIGVQAGLQAAQGVYALATGAPLLSTLVQAAPAALQLKEVIPMGFFDDFLGGASDLFSNIGDYLPSSETFANIASVAAPIASAFLAPSTQPRPAAMTTNFMPYSIGAPAGGPMPDYSGSGSAQPVGAFGVTASVILRATQPVLFKIAQALGLRHMPSLPTAISWIRQMGKYMAPAAIAGALGIGLDELATLITANARKKRRRMNPANVGALRRSCRRLESFHKLCSRVDVLRARGRRHTRPAKCPPFARKR